MDNHKNADEAREGFLSGFEDAVKNPNWLAVVFAIEDDKIVMKRLTTNKFPNGDMLKITSMFAKGLAESVDSSGFVEKDPLPQINLADLVSRQEKP